MLTAGAGPAVKNYNISAAMDHTIEYTITESQSRSTTSSIGALVGAGGKGQSPGDISIIQDDRSGLTMACLVFKDMQFRRLIGSLLFLCRGIIGSRVCFRASLIHKIEKS
jgi:hypothetical protein